MAFERQAPRPILGSDPVWTPIIAGLAEGVAVVLPSDGLVLWCNPSFAALLGSTVEDLVGRPLALFPMAGADDWSGDVSGLRPDGTTAPLDARVFTVSHPDLGPVRAVAMTSSHQAANRTAGAGADLAQFATVAAHDLRSPLQAVMGFGELLAGLDSVARDPLATEYATLLLRSVHRMHALVDALLNYFRVGAAPSEPSAVDCAALFAETADALEQDIVESGAKVTCDDLPVVQADGALLFVVFSNLMSNALKFHAPGVSPRVHVRAEHEQHQWLFRVTDNGIGIDPRFRERAFEMFRRLQGSEAYPGTGMGLAICKRAVESLQGRIWAESNDGAGTTICFTLPDRSRTR